MICHFRTLSGVGTDAAKAALKRSMAARCVAGDFNGSARRAASDPECIALGVGPSAIAYHMNLINPDASLARAADRARVATEAAAAAVESQSVQFIFVERGGAAPAAMAVSRIVDTLETGLATQVGNVVKMARRDGSASSQVEIETASSEKKTLVEELRQMKTCAAAAAVEAQRAAAVAARQIARLEAELSSSVEKKAADSKKVPLYGIRRGMSHRGGPYDRYFDDVIAPRC